MRIRFVPFLVAASFAVLASQACSTSSGGSGTSSATLKCTPVGQKDGNCPQDTPNTQADYNDCMQCLVVRQALPDCLTKQGYVYALGCDADGYTNVVNKPTDAQSKACQSQNNANDACVNAQLDAGADSGGGTDSAAQDSAAQDSGSGDDSSTGDDGGDAGTD